MGQSDPVSRRGALGRGVASLGATPRALLFTFLDKVEGAGYLAAVEVHGRVLAEEEDGEWWMYGVNPGGLAALGKTRPEAYAEFRSSLMKVLFDLATEARDFYAFRAAAREFFDQTDKVTVDEWNAARGKGVRRPLFISLRKAR